MSKGNEKQKLVTAERAETQEAVSRRAAPLFKLHLAHIFDQAKKERLEERVALMAALIDAPLRTRSLFDSATLLGRLSHAPKEDIEVHLRAEFFEFLADVAFDSYTVLGARQRDQRIRGGIKRAEQRRTEQQAKYAVIIAAERKAIADGTTARPSNKVIARATGFPLDYVRKAREIIKAAR